MIETRLMAPGSFSVKLRNPPERVRKLTARAYSAVLVMPTRISNPAKVAVADLFSRASYVGVHLGRKGERDELSGYGPAYLLTLAAQPDDQKPTKRPLYDNSSTSWLRNNILRTGVSETQGITVGPITVAAAASSPTKGGNIPGGQEPLETLSDVARRFGKEWDFRDGSKLEVAARASLFTVTPTCVVSPRAMGDDTILKALNAVKVTERDDWDDYATTVAVPFTADDYSFSETYAANDTIVATDGTYWECILANGVGTGAGTKTPGSAPSYWTQVDTYGEATTGSVPYVSPFSGSAIVARRVVQARNASTYDDATDIAAAQLAKYDHAQQDITVDTATFNIEGKVRAGDNVYVFSPDHDLVDSTAQVPFGGRLLPAATVRVQGIRTAVDRKKSVLFYSWNGSAFDLDDLTDWVEFEPEGQTLDLGSPRRRRARRGSGALVSPGFRGMA